MSLASDQSEAVILGSAVLISQARAVNWTAIVAPSGFGEAVLLPHLSPISHTCVVKH